MKLPQNLQETYCDFVTNTKLQILFDKVSVENFWVSTVNLYPELCKYILRLLIPFPSTYLAETSFSSLLAIKDNRRNKIDPRPQLICKISKLAPSIAKIITDKGKKEN